MIKKRMFKIAFVALSSSLLFACSDETVQNTNLASAAASEKIQMQVEAAANYITA